MLVNDPKTASDPILASLGDAEAKMQRAAWRPASPADLIPFCKVPSRNPNLTNNNNENTGGTPVVRTDTGLVQAQAWPHVLGMLAFWAANLRTVTLKSRQVNASWTMAFKVLHHCGWTPFRTVLVLNYTKEEAGKLIQKMSVLWASMPEERRPALKPSTVFGATGVEFANGSRVLALAAKDYAGAGETPTMLVVDEAALIDGLETIWPSVIGGAEYGEVHGFSTPRGESQFFARLCADAKAGTSPFKYQFIHYSQHPDKDPKTEQGRAWLAARKAELSAKDFAREHEGEFTRPGTAYFDDDVINRLRAGAREPMEILMRGKLRVWERPAFGKRYRISADISEGVEGGDWSAASVIEDGTHRVVATYRARLGVTAVAEDLHTIARMYFNALLAIEANNHGHAVNAWLFHHLGYRNLVREDRAAEGAVRPTAGTRLGVLTTSTTKPLMLAALEEMLRKGLMELFDIISIDELSTFICLADGGYGAAPGRHDDCVMNLAIGAFVSRRRRGARVA